MMLGHLREAWQLFQTDSGLDTFRAVLLGVVVIAPIAVGVWERRSS